MTSTFKFLFLSSVFLLIFFTKSTLGQDVESTCTQKQKNSCTQSCWINKLIGKCVTSCTCENCTTNTKCNNLCINRDAASSGKCLSTGACQCSYDCTSGQTNGGYCAPCCASSCQLRGYNGGTCSAGNICTCTQHTSSTCFNYCAASKGVISVPLCTNGTCSCGACVHTLCNDKCRNAGEIQGMCYGLEPTCICSPYLQDLPCEDAKCTTIFRARGWSKNCDALGSNVQLTCQAEAAYCDAIYCNSACQELNMGIGTCANSLDCVCSIPKTYACPA